MLVAASRSRDTADRSEEAKAAVRRLDAITFRQYKVLFDRLDTRGTGEIDPDVLEIKISRLGLRTTRDELNQLLHDIDVDGSGTINFDEFVLLLQSLTSTVGDSDALAGRVTGPCLTGERGKLWGWRRLVWETLEDSSLSPCARGVAIFIALSIVLSIMAFCMETVPYLGANTAAFFALEAFVTVIFTVEVIARMISAPSIRAYVTLLNILDIVAILPFYLDVGLESSAPAATSALRIVRVVRIVRVTKLSRYFSPLRLIGEALVVAAVPLSMAMFLTALAVLLFASAMYYAERGVWDDAQGLYISPETGIASEYQGILDGLWWGFVTMTTVGYGDVTPQTQAGKALAAVATLSGLIVLAFPISIVSAHFSELYNNAQRRKTLQEELSVDIVKSLSHSSTAPEAVESLPRFPNPHLSAVPTSVLLGTPSPLDARSGSSTRIDLTGGESTSGIPTRTSSMISATEHNRSRLQQLFRSTRLQTSGFRESVERVIEPPKATSLAEAVAAVKRAQRMIVMPPAEEDQSILTADSFKSLDLTQDSVLETAVRDLCRDVRKRAWRRVRRRAQFMRDQITVELCRRWRSWFEASAEAVLDVAAPLVNDAEQLQRETAVLRLSEIPAEERIRTPGGAGAASFRGPIMLASGSDESFFEAPIATSEAGGARGANRTSDSRSASAKPSPSPSVAMLSRKHSRIANDMQLDDIADDGSAAGAASRS